MFDSTFWSMMGYLWAGLAVAMAILFVVQIKIRDAGWVDVMWTAGLGVSAVVMYFFAEGNSDRRLLTAILAAAWSLRLTTHLFIRVWRGPEDGRYQAMRESMGDKKFRPFLFFFNQGQALLVVILVVPFWIAMSNQAAFPAWFDFAAGALWLISVTGEGIADYQLSRFKSKPDSKGKTCREGLWRYSRHPNYFFQSLFWWTFVLLSIGTEYWYLSLVSPALILLFILKFTGIPYTEAQAIKSRGDDYRAYQRETSAFVPWFPKKAATS